METMEYKLTLMGETQINLFRLLMNARIATTMKVCHKQKKFISFQANWFIFHVQIHGNLRTMNMWGH